MVKALIDVFQREEIWRAMGGVIFDEKAVDKWLRVKGASRLLYRVEAVLGKTDPFDAPTLEVVLGEFAVEERYPLRNVLNTLRVAVTGQMLGPGIYVTLEILGREVCRSRILSVLASPYLSPNERLGDR